VLGILFGVILGVLISVNLETLVHGLEKMLGFKFLDARVYFMSDCRPRAPVGCAENLWFCLLSDVSFDSVSRLARRAPAARRIPAQ
jgi:ABC-type lipoprotein release transport system permease subunit